MRILISCILLTMALISMSVDASPLDDARKAGYVIENPDGYVKAQPNASREIKALAADVNKRRLAAYERIARKNGISVKQVAAESYAKRMAAKGKK